MFQTITTKLSVQPSICAEYALKFWAQSSICAERTLKLLAQRQICAQHVDESMYFFQSGFRVG